MKNKLIQTCYGGFVNCVMNNVAAASNYSLSHSLETGITHLANYVILNSCFANTSVVEIGFCNTLA